MLQTTDYEETVTSSSRGRVSPIHTLHHLSFYAHLGNLWCAPRSVLLGVMTNDIIYMDPSPVGILNNKKLVG